MGTSWSYANAPKTIEEQTELKREVIRIGEKILAECTVDDYRQTAIQLLCYTYPVLGETEKAEKLALTMPPSSVSCGELLSHIYSGEKKFRQKQDCMRDSLTSLISDMGTNNNPLNPEDEESVPYTKEEQIIIYKKVIAILEIMFEDGNYGYYEQWISWTLIDMAELYVRLGDYDSAIESMTAAAEYSIKHDTEFTPDKEYTSLIFRGKKFGEVTHNVTSNDSMHQLEHMDYSVFNPIRENQEFIEIQEKLKKYAKKR